MVRETTVDGNAGKIRTVEDLLCRVRCARACSSPHTGAVWLRGLTDAAEHRLIPSIGVTQKFGGEELDFRNHRKLEQVILHQFRRRTFQFYGRALGEWEALFVARHFGLPVRLMDWTPNPLAALYFACEYRQGDAKDAKIWVMIPKKTARPHLDVLSEKTESPFGVKGVRLIYPVAADARINAQSGHFTIHEYPWTPLEQIRTSSYRDRDVDILELRGYLIPADRRAQLLKDLNDLQVTRRTLYPDLEGLAKGLVDAEILRSR